MRVYTQHRDADYYTLQIVERSLAHAIRRGAGARDACAREAADQQVTTRAGDRRRA